MFGLGLLQMNAMVGDVEGNVVKMEGLMEEGWSRGKDVLCFPELAVSGYMLEDKIFHDDFVSRVEEGVERLSRGVDEGKGVLVGGLERGEGGIYNSVYLLSGGRVVTSWRKQYLPNYDIFDEKRYFAEGGVRGPMMVGGVKVGALVCEDCWHVESSEALGETGTDIVVCCNASPYERGKDARRLQAVLESMVRSGCPCVYVNLVGGQDEMVFDGGSFVVCRGGVVGGRLPYFEEACGWSYWEEGEEGYESVKFEVGGVPGGAMTTKVGLLESEEEGMYGACILGLRDFVEKNGFRGVLLGMSGGIDSALSGLMAVDALGCDRVKCFRMPSRYTSDESMEEAELLCDRLGVAYEDREIGGIVGEVESVMGWGEGEDVGFGRENVQSRVRGLLLMAESNARGFMVLTTGNKSELAVGYATIYGDMCGGYSVLKDVYKGDVYRLSHWRNRNEREGYRCRGVDIISTRILERPPSAELRACQKDTDSLPDYEILDGILRCIVDDRKGLEETVLEGYDRETVLEVLHLLRRGEHKRHQAPPGVRLSARAFGRGWRYPITDGDRRQ